MADDGGMDSGSEEITEAELIRMFIAEALGDLHVALPATVKSYDSSKLTVSVELGCNRALPDGAGNFVSEQLPKLDDIPVKFQRCRQFLLTFPLVSGDQGLLVFCERNIASWRATGNPGDPGDLGTHTLDGAVFIPGLFSDGGAPATTDATNMLLGSDSAGESRIEIKPSGGGNLGAGATKKIARAGDPVQITVGGALATWMSLVEQFINAISPGFVTPLSATFLSTPGETIKDGSSSWKAVD
jgi:hypothetical protein